MVDKFNLHKIHEIAQVNPQMCWSQFRFWVSQDILTTDEQHSTVPKTCLCIPIQKKNTAWTPLPGLMVCFLSSWVDASRPVGLWCDETVGLSSITKSGMPNTGVRNISRTRELHLCCYQLKKREKPSANFMWWKTKISLAIFCGPQTWGSLYLLKPLIYTKQQSFLNVEKTLEKHLKM